jgi:hypothetical protein
LLICNTKEKSGNLDFIELVRESPISGPAVFFFCGKSAIIGKHSTFKRKVFFSAAELESSATAQSTPRQNAYFIIQSDFGGQF